MSKKGKRVATILFLAVVMGGLWAGYYFTSQSNREKEKEDEAAQDNSVELYQINKNDVAQIYFKNELSEVAMVKKDGGWVRDAASTGLGEDVPMNQEYVDAMLTELETVTAKTSLNPEGNLAQFGLDNPLLTVKVTMADNTEYDLVMGMEVPTDSAHYAIVGGDDATVYTLPFTLFEKFKYSDMEMVHIEETFEINTDNVMHMSLDREGMEPFEVRNVEGGYEHKYYEWRITKPYEMEVMADTENFAAFLGGFSSITFDGCAEYKAKDLSKYGLDKPKATLLMEYYDVVGSSDGAEASPDTMTALGEEEEEDPDEVKEDRSFTLLIGDKRGKESEEESGEDQYFVKLSDNDSVYLLPATIVDPILEMDVFHVSDQCVFLGLVTEMSGYEFTVNGEKHTVVRTEEKKAEEGESDAEGMGEADSSGEGTGEEEVEHVYHVDGQLVDATEFVAIFSATYLLEVSGLADDSVKPEDEASVLTLDYHMLTGEDVKLEFIPYDGVNFYRVVKNGMDYFLTDKRGVDDIVRRYTEFVEGM